MRFMRNSVTTSGLVFMVGLLLIGVHGRRTEDLDEAGRLALTWELNEDETEITFEL